MPGLDEGSSIYLLIDSWLNGVCLPVPTSTGNSLKKQNQKWPNYDFLQYAGWVAGERFGTGQPVSVRYFSSSNYRYSNVLF